ncbi:MAG: hypothetical protein RL260_3646 [Pseudomonadota bacterium]|jgi:hypothetical protein
MTDAELQAALAAGAPAKPAAAPTFDVFVDDKGAITQETPSTPAPVAAAPAAPSQSETLMQQLLHQNQALIAQMQGQQEAQARAVANVQATAPTIADFNMDSVLDANDREIYKDFLPLLAKVTAAQQAYVQTTHVAPLQQRVAELQRETHAAQQRAAGASDSSFTAALYARVPDLPKVVNTPEWRTYLKSQAPFSGGATVEQRVVQAYQAGDVATISEFYDGFAARRAAPGAPPAVAAAGAPGFAAQAPVANGVAGAPAQRYISQARLDAALAAAQSGRMSRDAYDKLMDDMLTAGLEGAQIVN